MNPFHAAIAAAQDAIASVGSVRVRIQRGDCETCLSAVPGRTPITIEDGEGARVRRKSRDYLIFTRDYRFDDGPTEPRAGDRIVEVLPDGREHTFELQPLAGGPCWSHTDNFGHQYRIHTREITDA